MRGGLSRAEVSEVGEELALDGDEASLRQHAQHLCVQVGDHVDVGGVRAKGGAKTEEEKKGEGGLLGCTFEKKEQKCSIAQS